MTPDQLQAFADESNKIEGLPRATAHEVAALRVLLNTPMVTVSDVCAYVQAVAGASIRNQPGMNVRIGRHVPMPGGPPVEALLGSLLCDIESGAIGPHEAHKKFERLHPFMDGNGRSGRAIWLLQHEDRGTYMGLGFLHQWYYESLDESGDST